MLDKLAHAKHCAEAVTVSLTREAECEVEAAGGIGGILMHRMKRLTFIHSSLNLSLVPL